MVPPYTRGKSWTLYIGTRAFLWPTHVAEQSWRVHPVNQASLSSLVEPVLPKTGREPRIARVPVPLVTTRSSMLTTSAAISGSTTCLHLPCFWRKTTFPLRSTTRVMANGSHRFPSLARVENADAISNGVTSFVPSVSEQKGCRGLSIPIRWAASTTFSSPASTESWTNTAFTELCVADH